MIYTKNLNQYRRSSIETAGKLDLIIMCYERAILLLTQARDHVKEKEYEKKVSKFQNALNIISELQTCLNKEKGGQIAENLDALYTYMTKRLLVGDIQKDLSAYDESIKILSELKEAWVAINSSEERQEDIYVKRNMPKSQSPHVAATY